MFTRLKNAFERRLYRWVNARMFTINVRPGIVSFTFDDFPESAATTAALLLEQRGWRGTYYFSPCIAGEHHAVGKISSMDLAARIYAVGHEIGNHTYSHFRCEGAKTADLRCEIVKSTSALTGLDGNRSFALPFGAYDAAALNLLSGRFDTIRTVQAGINRGAVDLNRLKANSVYHTMDFSLLRSRIRDVAEKGGWLILYTHDVCANPSPFGCTPKQFDQILDWIDECDIEVRTVAQTHASLIPSKRLPSIFARRSLTKVTRPDQPRDETR